MSKAQIPAEAVAEWNRMAEAPARERFAAAALTGILAGASSPPNAKEAAIGAWNYADAMIAERRRRQADKERIW